MDWAVLIFAALYAAGLLFLARGVARAQREASTAAGATDAPSVAVVLPARNEIANIGSCLKCLLEQDYPSDRLEIVVVDDRSEDGTGDVVRRLIPNHPNLRLVRVDHMPPGFAPKKFAIHRGIQSSQGEIILTTDADCRPPRSWIRAMASCFDETTGAVVGFSPLSLGQQNRLLHSLYRLDSLALASLAAGSVGMGYPLTCSGRNFAYRRQVYEELGGFGRYAGVGSGDDDLLLGRIRDETRWKVRYAFRKEAQVPAYPASSARALWNQRTRHASKALLYAWPLRLTAVGVYLFNFGFLIVALKAAATGAAGFFLASWALKCIPEFQLLRRTARALQFPAPLWLIPLISILHAVYVVVFGLAGQVRGFEWKGRLYRPAIVKGGNA